MVLHATQRHQKVVDTPILALSVNQTRHNHGMVACTTQGTGPKLGGRQSWRVNDEGASLASAVGFAPECRCRFEGANIGSLQGR